MSNFRIYYFCEKGAYIPMQELFIAEEIIRAGGKVSVHPILQTEDLHSIAADADANCDGVLIWQERMTVCSRLFHRAVELGHNIKKQVWFGGIFASIYASEIIEQETAFDSVIKGFGFADIAKVLIANNRDKLIECPGSVNLNNYELNLDLLEGKEKFAGVMQGYYTSQSCPNNCTYCLLPLRKNMGMPYQLRDFELVKQDIQNMKEKLDARYVSLKDPNFFARKDALPILSYIPDSGLKVKKNIDIELNDISEDLVSVISEDFGINAVFFGLESFSQEVLTTHFKKRSRIANFYKMLRWIDKYDVQFDGVLMFGFPWQTEDSILEDAHHALQLQKHHPHLLILFGPYFPIPGTPIYEEYFQDAFAGYTYRQKVNLYDPGLQNYRNFPYMKNYHNIDPNWLLNGIVQFNKIRFRLPDHTHNLLAQGAGRIMMILYEYATLNNNYSMIRALNRITGIVDSPALAKLRPLFR
ncbi:MAG: radical SAM protein [Candidatus Cloacimonetes bacterium]|nr:radical SAM protein [Candidatus Cloacimonadota bacterium]